MYGVRYTENLKNIYKQYLAVNGSEDRGNGRVLQAMIEVVRISAFSQFEKRKNQLV